MPSIILQRLFRIFREIHGDRNFRRRCAIIAGMAQFENRPW